MKYEVIKRENQIVSFVFSENICINAEVYSMISRNPSIMIPGIRDLSAPNTINYDVLGAIPLSEHLEKSTYDKDGFYNFLIGIIDVLQNIQSLGIINDQIVFDLKHTYVSMHDNSVRFICFPINNEDFNEQTVSPLNFFKNLVLLVNSSGAYELIGYIVEYSSNGEFNESTFRNGLTNVFCANGGSASRSDKKVTESSCCPINTEMNSLNAGLPFAQSYKNDPAVSSKEYIPEGIPFEFNGNTPASSDTIDPDNKTQVLFSTPQELGDLPYLSPIDNNTVEARIYIAGEKLSIGRSSDNDLQINISTVSGKHAEIHRSNGKCTVVDLNSTNKTYVNGKAIEPNKPVLLKHQDLIAFNKAKYRYFGH